MSAAMIRLRDGAVVPVLEGIRMGTANGRGKFMLLLALRKDREIIVLPGDFGI